MTEENSSGKDLIVHACAVYFYQYDPNSGQYIQQSDAVVGCVLLSSPVSGKNAAGSFKLLFYNAQKQPLLQTPIDPTMRFTPQQDNYINFYDQQQRNFSLRFKDEQDSFQFLRAIAFTKAQFLIQTSSLSASNAPVVVNFDDLNLVQKSHQLAQGDIAGFALKMWQGMSQEASGFTMNPMEIATLQTPFEAIEPDGDLKKIRIGDASNDAFMDALSQGVTGMQKHSKRVVTVFFPSTFQWVIAEMELIKVKKAKNSSEKSKRSKSSADTANHGNDGDEVTSPYEQQQQTQFYHGQDEEAEVNNSRDSVAASPQPNGANEDLIRRMASLSRIGSHGSGLIASISSHNLFKNSPSSQVEEEEEEEEEPQRQEYSAPVQRASFHQQQSTVPVSAIAPSSNMEVTQEPLYQQQDQQQTASSSASKPPTVPAAPVMLPEFMRQIAKRNSMNSSESSSSSTTATTANAAPSPSRVSFSVSAETPPIEQQQAPSHQGTRSSLQIDTSNSTSSSASVSTSSTSSTTLTVMNAEMEKLLKEQSDLEQMRLQLEENKKKMLLANTIEDADVSSMRSLPNSSRARTSSSSSSIPEMPMSSMSFQPPPLPPTPSSNFGNGYNALTLLPPNLPSFTGFHPNGSSFLTPQPPPSTPSSSTSYGVGGSGMLSARPSSIGPSASTNTFEIENGLHKLQRASSNIETTLHDMHHKMDRLLNLYVSSSSLRGGSGSTSNSLSLYGNTSSSIGTPTSSSSTTTFSSANLLKSLEKALTQRDTLVQVNAGLEETKNQLEERMEELFQQNQQLDQQNHFLLTQKNSKNQLQQEQIRLEMNQMEQKIMMLQQQLTTSEQEKQHVFYQIEQLKKSKQIQQEEEKDKQKQILLQQFQQEKHILQQEFQTQLNQLQQTHRLQLNAIEQQIQKNETNQLKEIEKEQKQLSLHFQQEMDKFNQIKQQELGLLKETSLKQQAQLQQETLELQKQFKHMQQLFNTEKEKNSFLQIQMDLMNDKKQKEMEEFNEILKEFMNEVYFHFQDAFEEENEFTGKEIVTAIRKILKQNTVDILQKIQNHFALQQQQQDQEEE